MEDNKDNFIYKRLVGGLDLDSNIGDVAKNDFIYGYDIVDNNPKSKNEKGLLQPCSNTKFAYDLGEAIATYKKYRVSFDFTGLANCVITFQIDIAGLVSRTTSFSYVSGTNAAAALIQIQGIFSGETITTITATGFLLVFDIELSSTNIFSAFCYTYTDYTMTVYNSLGDNYSCETRVDAVSVEKVGNFNPSCFCNINSAQQIFSTTNKSRPEVLEATIPVTANGVFLVFATDPLISDGEEVYIYPKESGVNKISAVCIVQKELSDYTVVGVRSEAIGISGNYYVVRNYRTLSSIGYATKNDIIDQWNYTELLRSNKLNFRLYKQIQGALDITSDGIIYDWTDFLNTPRRLIYKGDIIENGFLTTYNADAYYNLDNIEDASRLQIGANTSKVTLLIPQGAGGSYAIGFKKEACYVAFVRFKTEDGAFTTYSKASNILWLHSNGVKDHNYSSNSGRSLGISIEQINSSAFSEVQVGIIEFTSSAWIGYSLPSIQVGDSSTVNIIDSGENIEAYLDFNSAAILLEQIPFVFENAKSILAYTNYRLLANVNLYQEYDLTDWAQTIQLTAKYRSILIGSFAFYALAENTYATILRGINDYSKCSNEWMSYMPYDHYRFCIFVDWINGSPTSTYWINDLSFDPSDTGLDVGDAVTIGDPLDTYSILQYYLEATNIDLSYVLPDGKLLKEVVKDIRFGRALCNQQVQTTGFGMSVYQDAITGDDYVSGFVDGANNPVDDKLALYSSDFQNTQDVFNWNDGDLIKVKLIESASSTTTDTSNVGVVFISENLGTSLSIPVKELINIESQSTNPIALYKYSNLGDIYIRDSAIVTLDSSLDTSFALYRAQLFYYLKPYGSEGAYPESPTQTRFFVVPQDKWFDKDSHNETTIYSIYGGDAFPTLSAYKVAENNSDQLKNNSMFSYWHFNRTNTALRSGRFPFYTLQNYLKDPYLVDPIYERDRYTYDTVFTPKYPFQNQVAFNPLLPQFTNKFSSLYYSNQGFGSDNAGGNRIWLPLDMKTLETKYGAITHFDVLLGQTGTNILIVWQERRLTAQYFDNTANIKSNTGELLVGNGEVLGREGQNLTEYGCEHKQTIKKGQSKTGKDVAYWLCLRKTAIMRFGADGTSNIIGNITYLIENKTLLGLNNSYNNDDEPAFFNGIHAVWDNKRMEYILTMRLYPKCIPSGTAAMKGEFVKNETLTWGFEGFPVLYQSLIDDNISSPPNSTWKTIQGYSSNYFEIITIVWSEVDNVYKTFRTYSPKIYGQFNDNYVSSHPTEGSLIYEHNDTTSEALYYDVETTTEVTAVTDPATFRINGIGIESTFPSPFAAKERQKYIVKIENKNYEVVGTGADYLQMSNIDDDDILPQATITNFSYSVVNSQDPYIEGVANETKPVFVEYGLITTQNNEPLKGMRFIAGLNSLDNQEVESSVGKAKNENYYQGTTNQQIPSPTTPVRSMLQGYWMKFKLIWRWGKKNKVDGIIINHTKVDKQI